MRDGFWLKIVGAIAIGITLGAGLWARFYEIPIPAPVLEAERPVATPTPGKGQVKTTLVVRDGDTGTTLAARVDGRALRNPLIGHPRRQATVRAPGYPPETITVTAGTMEVKLWSPGRQSRIFGSTPGRTRVLKGVNVAPPGRSEKPLWTYGAGSLVEFPPSVAEGVLVVATNGGRVQALDAVTGQGLWQHKVATVAASPAIVNDTAYIVDMKGVVSAFALDDGHLRWRLRLGSPIETSPLIVDGKDLVIGTWDRRLLRVAGKSGRIMWTQRLDGEVKGAAALSDRDTVIVGDYAGVLWSLHKRTGRVMWRQDVGSRFYGGPGVMGNYTVIGDVGGDVICVNTRNGATRWRHSTGGYVYGSPAIYDGAAFIGSYSGRFERLDLDTGRVDWSFDMSGRVSGSAFISKGVVYAAVLYRPGEPRHTYGLDIRSGAVRMDRPDGRYTPGVTAGQMMYLVGTKQVTAWR